MQKNLQKILEFKEHFVKKEVDNEIILVPLSDEVAKMDELFTLNDTGSLLWNNLEFGVTQTDLETILKREYDIDEAEAKKDTEEFLKNLTHLLDR